MNEDSSYQATRDELSKNTVMSAMLWRDAQCVAIQTMTDEELAEARIARRDESGRLVPFSQFMNAANQRFRELEGANPKYRFEGSLHIGAVAEVILAQRDKVAKIRRDLISLIANKLGKTYDLADDATPAEVKAVCDQATEDLCAAE